MARKHTVMLVVCCWCKTPQRMKDGKGQTGETSTICPACVKKYFPEVAEEHQQLSQAAA